MMSRILSQKTTMKGSIENGGKTEVHIRANHAFFDPVAYRCHSLSSAHSNEGQPQYHTWHRDRLGKGDPEAVAAGHRDGARCAVGPGLAVGDALQT
ncbi:hypothetical protein SDC9_113888 [bioreactor metagenome]|uniref:Uncharacterized protein n=1 Tax=bioreactor metagenome TaxID=1076179 RepID=A0A645BZ34_9ZZZZ